MSNLTTSEDSQHIISRTKNKGKLMQALLKVDTKTPLYDIIEMIL